LALNCLDKVKQTSWLGINMHNKTHFIVYSFADIFEIPVDICPLTVMLPDW